MPRPRFHRLSADKQAHILDVASEEFAELGFEGASYNRIIERAGLSKGAMYYYFDDKTDLYGTVVKRALEGVTAAMARLGDIPQDAGPEAFWASFERVYLESLRFAVEHPRLGALVRGLFEHPERQRQGAIAEVFETFHAITEQMVDRGLAAGAIRRDLPRSLLVTAAFALGEALDRWTLENFEDIGESRLRDVVGQLTGLYRRLLEPDGRNA